MPSNPSPSLPVDRVKLAKLLAMLDSEHDGEALNAARAAHRMVLQAGTSWEKVIALDGYLPDLDFIPDQTIQSPTGPLLPPHGKKWAYTVTWLCSMRADRNERERDFLDRLSGRLVKQGWTSPPQISPEAAAWVLDIYNAVTAGSPKAF